jgi:hypothetical protein
MRNLMLAAAVGLFGLSGAGAVATAETRQSTTYVCLDPGGAAHGVLCDRTLNTSADDFCHCPGNTDKVRVAVCDPGQAPPAQSHAYELAMHRASADGSLIGDSFDDRPMCVRDTVTGRHR